MGVDLLCLGNQASPVAVPKPSIMYNENQTKSIDITGPSMRYYLRKYYYQVYWEFEFNLSLQVLVQDPNGVDTVLMMYSYAEGPWQNLSMTEDTSNASWFRCFLLFPANLSETPITGFQGYTYQVKYAAKDLLNDWAVTDTCTYQILFGGYVEDGVPIELYDTPDLWYLTGTTGHTVTWEIGRGGPNHYMLYEDGYLIESWSWTGSLTISVDGLSLGDHVFALSVSAGWTSSSDSVTVHVVNELPVGYTIQTVGPRINPVPDIPVLAFALAAAASVTVAVVCVKRRQSKSTARLERMS